jgi:hypothetical protein
MNGKRDLTRAEQVRTRRRQQPQKRPLQNSAVVSRSLPPVVSRSGLTNVTQQKAVTPNTARRFQTAFSMAGFELRMPAVRLPNVQVKSRLLSLFLSLFLGAAIYLGLTLPEFRVAAALVTGNQRLSATEINSVLSSSGQPIFTIVPGDLETRLRLNYPELTSAHVILSLPNIMSVKIVERQPVILWQQNGGITWIDQNGVAFRPHGSAANLIKVNALAAPSPGLPVVNDPLSPLPYLSADMVKGIETLAPNVPAGTTMIYDPQDGLGWSDSRGWKVTFGNDPQDMALKLQVYQSLVASLVKQGVTPVFISIQYVNAPYYRMSQ